MTRLRAAAVLLCALAGAAAAGPSAAQARKVPLKAQAVPFSAGESLTYDISWASFLTAGTATLSVRERKPSYGSEAYYVVAEGRPTPLLAKLYDLYYKADSLLDVYTLVPQRASIYSEEGSRHRNRVTTFDQVKHRARYEVQTATLVTKDLAIAPFSQDALGAIYALRAIALKQGDAFSIPVCDAGESFTVQVAVGGVETVRTGIGDVRAWRITPTLPGSVAARQLAIWISDDARRLPVRMEAQVAVGSFELVLRSVSGGR